METGLRSVRKALRGRGAAKPIAATLALVVTGTLHVAASTGLTHTVLSLGAGYGHECAWNRVSIGRAKAPEHQI